MEHGHIIPMTAAVFLIVWGLLAYANVTGPLQWIAAGVVLFIFGMWHDKMCKMKGR